MHSSLPSVAVVYATLWRQSARFRCRSPASSPSTLHVSWARTSPCTEPRLGWSAHRNREPCLQGRRQHLSAGAQGGGQGREDGVAGDCGWCSGVAQVEPQDCGHRRCQSGSAHRQARMGFDVGFFGGNKSAYSTWAQRATAGEAIRKKALDKGQPLATKAAGVIKRTKTFSQTIATHSHQCKHPSCRLPAKMSSKMDKGREVPGLSHRCLVTNGQVGGLGNHLCSTCHRTGLVCRDKVCRGVKCTRSRPDCAHLHDG